MIVAGIGCRRGCPAEAIVALVRGTGAQALAAPAWKRGEPGLLEAAAALGVPLWFVAEAALAAVQQRCPTHSAAVADAVGLGSVAEAAVLAVGGVLTRARFGGGLATCATGACASLGQSAGELHSTAGVVNERPVPEPPTASRGSVKASLKAPCSHRRP